MSCYLCLNSDVTVGLYIFSGIRYLLHAYFFFIIIVFFLCFWFFALFCFCLVFFFCMGMSFFAVYVYLAYFPVLEAVLFVTPWLMLVVFLPSIVVVHFDL